MIQEELKRRAEIINSYIAKYLPEKDLGLYKAARHLIKAGGKRVRPAMAMLSSEALGENYERIIPAIVALEAIHNFTLIHDDAMDRDEMRRGVKTVHTVFGEATAILAGDTLFAEAFSLLPECDVEAKNIARATKLLADVCVKICEGQFLDMNFETSNASEKDYMEMVKLKTGVLIATSASIPAVLFGRDEFFESLWEFGLSAGIAFQIYDDILDLTTGTGKDFGSDIVKGKKTLIVIKAFEKGVKLDTFGKLKASIEDIKKDIEKLHECGAVEYAKKVALDYARAAKEKLSTLPDSEGKRLLLELADFFITRKR